MKTHELDWQSPVPPRPVTAAEVTEHMAAVDAALPRAPGLWAHGGGLYYRTGDGRVVPCAADVTVASTFGRSDIAPAPQQPVLSRSVNAELQALNMDTGGLDVMRRDDMSAADIRSVGDACELLAACVDIGALAGITGDTLNWSHIDMPRIPWRALPAALPTADADTLQRLHEQVAPRVAATLRAMGITDRAAIDAAARVAVVVLGAVVLEGRQG